jgi:hypothetical protein
MRSYIHDIVHATRTLARARAFTAVCIQFARSMAIVR